MRLLIACAVWLASAAPAEAADIGRRAARAARHEEQRQTEAEPGGQNATRLRTSSA